MERWKYQYDDGTTVRSQPTYKGWKVYTRISIVFFGTRFPAYLQGMEREDGSGDVETPGRFPAYLQGMESNKCGAGQPGLARSQPTYKGWKAVNVEDDVNTSVVPSLPTRDGKSLPFTRRNLETWSSQPTYKGWKAP